MNLYDALMLFIVGWCAISGSWRGMAWQIAPIASLVVGYLFAAPLSEQVAPYFGQPPHNRLTALVVAYLVIALGVYLLVRSVKETLDKLKLTEFDHHLGFLFGAVKGILITLVITFSLVSFSPTARNFILKSESSSLAPRIVQKVVPILPAAIVERIEPYIRNLDQNFYPTLDRSSQSDFQLADEYTPSNRVAPVNTEVLRPRSKRSTGGRLPTVDKHLPGTDRGDATRRAPLWDDDADRDQELSDWNRNNTARPRAPSGRNPVPSNNADPAADDGLLEGIWSDAKNAAKQAGQRAIEGMMNDQQLPAATPSRNGTATSNRDNRRTPSGNRNTAGDRNAPGDRTLQDEFGDWATDTVKKKFNSTVDSALQDIERAVTTPRRTQPVPPPADDDFFFNSPPK